MIFGVCDVNGSHVGQSGQVVFKPLENKFIKVNWEIKYKNKTMDKRELLRYVGDCSQILGIRECVLSGGKAKGIKAFDIRNGSGLEMTVLADRCLDISSLSINGINCGYMSSTGIVAPKYYESGELGFFRNFSGGFLTTCGLRNVGNPCEDGGEQFDIHGRIANIPAEEVYATTEWGKNGIPEITVSGKMRETRFFGENLLLKRKIVCRYGDNSFRIYNTVENCGFRRELLMLLFHFNLGYPLLDEDAELIAPSTKIEPRDAEAAKGAGSWNQMQPPTNGYAEQVFYHDLKTDKLGNSCVALINRRLETGLSIRFNTEQLFNLTQWKQMGEGAYVLGLEPCNCYVGGRTDPRNKNIVEYLEPGETREYNIEITLVNGVGEIKSLEKFIICTLNEKRIINK